MLVYLEFGRSVTPSDRQRWYPLFTDELQSLIVPGFPGYGLFKRTTRRPINNIGGTA